MSLLHLDGFDLQATFIGQNYPLVYGNNWSSYTHVAGRAGTGYAVRGGYTERMNWTTGPLTSSGTMIVGFAIKNGLTASGTRVGLVSWRSGGVTLGHVRVVQRDAAPAGQLTVWLGGDMNGGAQSGAATSTPLSASVYQYFEIKIVAGTGTSGSVTIRQDGVQTLALTGINTGAATIDEIGFPWSSDGGNYGLEGCIDDLYICNTAGTLNNDFLGDTKVLTLVPNGAGATTQLTPSAGSNYQCVDEIPPVLTDYVSGSTVGNKDLYAYPDISTTYTVRGVQVHSYAGTDSGSTAQGRTVAVSGATTSNGVTRTLSATPKTWRDVYETDPNTAAAWTAANANAAQFGWEVRA